jgi:tetratricopeptide (TPR) repeat protein
MTKEKFICMKLFMCYHPDDIDRFQIRSLVEWIENHLPLKVIYFWHRENQISQTLDAYYNFNMMNSDIIMVFCSESLNQHSVIMHQIDLAAAMQKTLLPVFDNWEFVPKNLRSIQNITYTPKQIENFRNIVFNFLSHHSSLILPEPNISTLSEGEIQAFLENAKAIQLQSVNNQNLKPNSKLWIKMGLFYAKIKELLHAEIAFRMALQLSPQEPLVWQKTIQFMQNLKKDTSELEWLYSKALELNSTDTKMWIGFGEFYQKNKLDYAKAEKCYRKAVESNSKSAETWLKLAEIFKTSINNKQDSERCYRNVLEMNPQNVDAWINLGNLIYVAKKKLDDALECFSKARQYLTK